jgi:hypothetical protein
MAQQEPIGSSRGCRRQARVAQENWLSQVIPVDEGSRLPKAIKGSLRIAGEHRRARTKEPWTKKSSCIYTS